MHKAKACVILCIDFRFQKHTQKWLDEQGYNGSSDEIVVAGVCRDIASPIEDFHRQSLLRQIDLSVKLHDPDEIVIVDHQDCGGYAQDGTIPSGLDLAEDKKHHQEYARKVNDELQALYPDKVIKNFYSTLSGEVQPLFD